MWTGSHDNYAYLIVDDKTKDAMILDPANPPEVLPVLKEQINSGKINLKGIINTHHHYDHAGGNTTLLKEFDGIPILGGEDCISVSKIMKDGETFNIGENVTVKALRTPCHTQDSVCYFVQDGDDKAVFTGDTLFIAGCGRFFEGTGEEMHKALNKILASLPDDTKVFPGHEYTKSNVKFARSVIDTLAVHKLERFCEQNDRTEGKFTIGDEKKHNVFMMVEDPEVQKAVGETDPVEVMEKLREMKNNFRS
ncbi:Cytoplasmic glyoxalase II [Rhizina undulata]